MSKYESITSPQNPKVKLIKKLRDKRGREREKLFVIDTPRDLERAIAQGYRLYFALYCPLYATPQDARILEQIPANDTYEVPGFIFEKIAYRQNPSSILAVMRAKPQKSFRNIRDIASSHILGLVKLTKPGNIGALLRTADATGFDPVFLIDIQIDLYNPNIIRSSTGACFLNNIYYLREEEAIHFFRTNEYNVIAGHLNGGLNLFTIDFTQPTIVLLGSEDTGLDAKWIQSCDFLVKIPMIGRISDSLNVSVSGAVFMYEALRQRLTTAS